MTRLQASIVALSLDVLVACGAGPPPTSPSPSSASPDGLPAPGANGSVTWIGIDTSRTLCHEITGQVGTTYPLWLILKSDGAAVTLRLSHDGPVSDDQTVDDLGYTFAGTRHADAIRAVWTDPVNGLGCPGDSSVMRRVGGELSGTISSNEIAGGYTEVYGTSADQVTFVFRFRASF